MHFEIASKNHSVDFTSKFEQKRLENQAVLTEFFFHDLDAPNFKLTEFSFG